MSIQLKLELASRAPKAAMPLNIYVLLHALNLLIIQYRTIAMKSTNKICSLTFYFQSFQISLVAREVRQGRHAKAAVLIYSDFTFLWRTIFLQQQFEEVFLELPLLKPANVIFRPNTHKP